MEKLKYKYFAPKRASESAWSIVQIGEEKKDCIYFCTKHCTAGLSIIRPGGIKRNITATITTQHVKYHHKHKNNQFTILVMGEQKRGATTYTIEIEDTSGITTLFKHYILQELISRGTPYTGKKGLMLLHHLRGSIAAPLAPRDLVTLPQMQRERLAIPNTQAVTALFCNPTLPKTQPAAVRGEKACRGTLRASEAQGLTASRSRQGNDSAADSNTADDSMQGTLSGASGDADLQKGEKAFRGTLSASEAQGLTASRSRQGNDFPADSNTAYDSLQGTLSGASGAAELQIVEEHNTRITQDNKTPTQQK